MTDPVTKTEIEDVLASIRRLVSVDDRAPQASVDSMQSREADKLILTPSQRIDESTQDAGTPDDAHDEYDVEVAGEVDDVGSHDVKDADQGADWSDDDGHGANAPFNEAEAVGEPDTQSAEPEFEEESGFEGHDPFEEDSPDGEVIEHSFRHSEDQQTDSDQDCDAEAEPEPDAADYAEPSETHQMPEEDETWEPEEHEASGDEDVHDTLDVRVEETQQVSEEQDYSATESDIDEDSQSGPQAPSIPQSELEARIAEVEAAVAARADEFEPDGSMPEEMMPADAKPMQWRDTQDEAEIEEAELVEDDELEHEAVETGPEEAQAEEAEVEEAVTAESESKGSLEDAVDPQNDGYQDEPEAVTTPDPEMEEVYEAEAETVEELNEAAAEEAAMQATTDTEAKPENSVDDIEDAAVWASDEAVLDEDALRDMVSDIVRQELQGALGERITRNVRKLVRREIHRALMSQGIE